MSEELIVCSDECYHPKGERLGLLAGVLKGDFAPIPRDLHKHTAPCNYNGKWMISDIQQENGRYMENSASAG